MKLNDVQVTRAGQDFANIQEASGNIRQGAEVAKS